MPSAPAPYTSTLPPGGGGCRVMECSDTANGSANTATSSVTPSGTRKSIESSAGMSVAHPPVASLDVPVWIPGAMGGSRKLQHRLRSPAAQAGHTGDTPRGSHESHGLSTTRSPTSKPSASGPSATTSATTSCPSTCGNDVKSTIGLSRPTSPQSMNTCFASEPQMPVSSGRVTTQSGSRNPGSSRSTRSIGACREGGDERVVGVGLRHRRRCNAVEQRSHGWPPLVRQVFWSWLVLRSWLRAVGARTRPTPPGTPRCSRPSRRRSP